MQRRRPDIRRFLDTDTAFPSRLDREATYAFSPGYRQLFDDLVDFAREKEGETLLCEEIVPLAATGPADNPQWLTGADSERLLAATPEGNPGQTRFDQQLARLIGVLPDWQAALEPVAQERAAAQRVAHERVREAARMAGCVTLEPVLPVDVLGAYLLLPVMGR